MIVVSVLTTCEARLVFQTCILSYKFSNKTTDLATINPALFPSVERTDIDRDITYTLAVVENNEASPVLGPSKNLKSSFILRYQLTFAAFDLKWIQAPKTGGCTSYFASQLLITYHLSGTLSSTCNFTGAPVKASPYASTREHLDPGQKTNGNGSSTVTHFTVSGPWMGQIYNVQNATLRFVVEQQKLCDYGCDYLERYNDRTNTYRDRESCLHGATDEQRDKCWDGARGCVVIDARSRRYFSVHAQVSSLASHTDLC